MAANQRQNQHFHMCIHCHQKEDLQHLYQCLQRREWRKEFLGKMRQYCTNTNTPPTLKGTLMRGLTECMDTDTSPTEHKAHPQNTIGWNLLLRRFIVKDFNHHYQKNISDRNPAKPATTTHMRNPRHLHLTEQLTFSCFYGKSYTFFGRNAAKKYTNQQGTTSPHKTENGQWHK